MEQSMIAEATNLDRKQDINEISHLKYFIERDQIAMSEILQKYDELLNNQNRCSQNDVQSQKELIDSLRE